MLLFLCLPLAGFAQQFKVLAISKTEGFRHESIGAGVEALKKLAQENHFLFDHTEDVDIFAFERLHDYDVVVLLNTTGEIFLPDHQEGFKKFVRDGKGVVGIHSATDTAYEWPWYNRMIGAQFESHPQIQTARVKILRKDHPATAHLPENWIWTDEWYNFKNLNDDIKILMEVDGDSYDTGDEKVQSLPIAWYQEYEGGRVFYTGLGHVPHAYEHPLFLQHLLGGIWYAATGNQ